MIVISPPCGILIFQKLSYLHVLCVFMFVSMLLTSNSNKIDYKKERKKEKRKKHHNTRAWMNSSIRPLGNRPRRRGPCPCFDINSNVRISSSRSKNTSTPSPYILARTFLETVFVGHFIW